MVTRTSGTYWRAAFCPSLLAGQGAALAMTAAYVLAGELAQTGGAPQQAFKRYENRLHAFIAGKQKSATDFAGSFTPKTRLGLFFRNQVSKMFRLPFIAENALNPDVGLIHLPTVVGRSEPRSQSALNFWGVTLHPPPDGDVVDRKSALGKEFLHVAVGQRELQIPANRQQDDLRFELPPLEKTRNRRREQEHRTSLSDHASKVATLPASVTKAPSITAKPPSISTRTVDHAIKCGFTPLSSSRTVLAFPRISLIGHLRLRSRREGPRSPLRVPGCRRGFLQAYEAVEVCRSDG